MTEPPDLTAVFDHFGVQYRTERAHVNQMVLCINPEHPERRPSCNVHLVTGVWKCMSCDAQGGVYDAIMLLAKLGSRREAAEWAAENGLGTGDSGGRGELRAGRRIPGTAGFKPRYRNSLPPWRRD